MVEHFDWMIFAKSPLATNLMSKGKDNESPRFGEDNLRQV
jgi:hypothetical protein